MRSFALALFSAALFTAPVMKADVITFINDYGTGQSTFPAYYVGGCNAASDICGGVDGYAFTVVSNTIPATTYIGDPSGNVSDMITSSVHPPSTCSPMPACLGQFTDVQFTFTPGLDLTGSAETCASVGGCAFTYSSGSLQTIGSIVWGPGFGTPTPGFTTTLQYESLIGTLLTTTLTNFNGGSHTDPVLLPSNQPVGQVTGTIGGLGTEDYYTFYWAGGFFSATSSVNNPSPNPGASYQFSEGSGSCTSGASTNLDTSNSFTGTISVTDLPAGTYCIGIAANNAADPPFSLTFNTPTSATPEPSTFAMLFGGLAVAAALRLQKR